MSDRSAASAPASASRRLVDPELAPLLDMFPTVVLTHETLAELRAANAQAAMPIPPELLEAVACERRSVPGPAGAPEISVLIYRPAAPAAGPLPCIYHIHGGGMVGGAAAEFEFLHRPLVADLGCVLVSVDYRLAPETRFPGAIEDCYAGLDWLFAQTASLGVDPARIGVMGESAGGGLAAALSLMVRDRGEHRLAFQHLIYPMLDDRTCADPDPHPYTGEFIWTAHNNTFGWSALLGGEPGSPGVSEYAAPARAKDLSNLPPAFISTGGLDLFLEEDLEYARRLSRAGVPVELHVYPGAFHGFDALPLSEVSRNAQRDSRAALRRALGV